MRRFTIRKLMGLVVVLAVGIAAVRDANEYWASGFYLVTPMIFGLALIAAISGSQKARSGRYGFAVLGGIYFALSLVGSPDPSVAKLPTSKLLWYVHDKVADRVTFTVSFATPPPAPTTSLAFTKPPRTGVTTQAMASSTYTVTSNNAVPSGSGGGAMTVMGGTQYVTAMTPTSPSSTPPNRWKVMLPGAANYEAFQTVGHCMFALLFGWIGASVARRIEHRANRSNSQLAAVAVDSTPAGTTPAE